MSDTLNPATLNLTEFTRHYPVIFSDDEISSHKLMMILLYKRLGLHAVSSSLATDTLMICQHYPVSLVISDITNPGMSGFELLKALRGNPRTQHIPLIFITARSDADSMLRAEEMGADAYFTKPFAMGLPEFGETVIRLLHERHELITAATFARTWQSDTSRHDALTDYCFKMPEGQWRGHISVL